MLDFVHRKASLALLRKMVHYVTSTLLDDICSLEGSGVNFGSQLVEVLSTVLDNEVMLSAFLSSKRFGNKLFLGLR